MLRDIEYLIFKLGKLSGFGDLGSHFMQIVRGKEIQVTPRVGNDTEEPRKLHNDVKNGNSDDV